MKKLKWNSKQIAVAICIAIALLLVVGHGITIYRIYRLPESHVEITGSIVDNRYNNFISEYDLLNTTGDFVRIGEKLYYNYYGSYASYGLYEITSDGVRRIQWDGYGPWAFLIGHEIMLYPIQAYNGKLLINTTVDGNYYTYNKETKEWVLTQGRIQTYSEETRTFAEAMLFGGISDINTLSYQETSFGFVYESSDEFNLWVYTEERGPERIVADKVCSFYTVGDQIYYTAWSEAIDSYVLHVYDWKLKMDTVLCEWLNYANMTNFMVEEGNLIFVASHPAQKTRSLYKFNLSNPQAGEKAIYTSHMNASESEYIYSMNVWNGTVYLCTEKGLIACDLDTGEYRILCEKNAYTCYIVDDTWVYFAEHDSNYLWRVPQSGGEAELVFGHKLIG